MAQWSEHFHLRLHSARFSSQQSRFFIEEKIIICDAEVNHTAFGEDRVKSLEADQIQLRLVGGKQKEVN